MKANQLTPEQMEWIKENETMFRVSLRIMPDKLAQLFAIYNHVTGQNMKPTTCGRCIENTKKTVYGQYKSQL